MANAFLVHLFIASLSRALDRAFSNRVIVSQNQCVKKKNFVDPRDESVLNECVAMNRKRCFLLIFLTGLLTAGAHAATGQAAISSASPEATAAGAEILARGGNAADAAVAIAFTLGVTEPAMSGLGGQIQFLIRRGDQDVIALNGGSFAPALTDPAAVRGEMNPYQRTTVPTWLKSLEFLWREYGSGNIRWRELIEPALGHARDGFAQGVFRQKVFLRHEDDLAGYLAAGHMQAEGAIVQGGTIRQPQLAATLEKIAEGGSEVFYRGEIAERIEQDMIDNGGWIRKSDLARVSDPVPVDPVSADYRAYRVFSFPPPAGGWVMMQTLKLYEKQHREGWTTEAGRQAMTRSIFLAQRDRREHPVENFDDFGDFLERKLSEDYVAALLDRPHSIDNSGLESNGGETTHFSLIDADGFAISATTSINAYYGVRAASPELGFLYNSYMDDFIFGDPGHPYAIAPGKPAYSSMSPSIVTRDGETVLVLGSPGSARIISAVAQVIAGFVEAEDSLFDLLATPRIHVTGGGSLYLENPDWLPSIEPVGLEYGVPRADLAIEGLNAYFGGIHAVGRLRGEWQAAADPRRDGASLVLAP